MTAHILDRWHAFNRMIEREWALNLERPLSEVQKECYELAQKTEFNPSVINDGYKKQFAAYSQSIIDATGDGGPRINEHYALCDSVTQHITEKGHASFKVTLTYYRETSWKIDVEVNSSQSRRGVLYYHESPDKRWIHRSHEPSASPLVAQGKGLATIICMLDGHAAGEDVFDSWSQRIDEGFADEPIKPTAEWHAAWEWVRTQTDHRDVMGKYYPFQWIEMDFDQACQEVKENALTGNLEQDFLTLVLAVYGKEDGRKLLQAYDVMRGLALSANLLP